MRPTVHIPKPPCSEDAAGSCSDNYCGENLPGKPELFFVFRYASCVRISKNFPREGGVSQTKTHQQRQEKQLHVGKSCLRVWVSSLRVALPAFAVVVGGCYLDMKNRSVLWSTPSIPR